MLRIFTGLNFGGPGPEEVGSGQLTNSIVGISRIYSEKSERMDTFVRNTERYPERRVR